MLNENDVINYLCDYLQNKGYTIIQQLNTNEKGIDIIAEKDGSTFAIEAKGATSSKEQTNRYNKPFSRSQAKHHIAMAIYKCCEISDKGVYDSVGIALPNDKNHSDIVSRVCKSITKFGFKLFLVNEDGTVQQEV